MFAANMGRKYFRKCSSRNGEIILLEEQSRADMRLSFQTKTGKILKVENRVTEEVNLENLTALTRHPCVTKNHLLIIALISRIRVEIKRSSG